MPNLYIATDEQQIRYGTKEYVEQKPYTRMCVELVSEELFDAILAVGSIEKNRTGISHMLYFILDKKWLSSN